MGRFVNPDNTTFKAALNTKIYVDKTKLIDFTNSLIGTTENFICNSRPRRFGKSYTANMLAAYYSKGCDSRELFADLAVAATPAFEKYINKFDVIHFDLQWFFTRDNIDSTVDFITETIVSELREVYKDIVTLEIKTIPDALSKINSLTGNQFVIIIDEWDMLIRDAANNKAIQEKYIDFLRRLFKGMEPEKYVALAYITGILPIKKYKTQSALNNFEEYTMLAPGELAPYIGFTESEVKALCEKYNKSFAEVKRWYDGYQLGNYHVYNPRAVVSVMKRGTFQSYWTQTGTYESIVPLIDMNFAGLKTDIISMLSGDTVPVQTNSYQNDMVNFKNKNDVLTSLIHFGYLAYEQMEQRAYIPNEEIRSEFLNAVEESEWDEFLDFQKLSRSVLNATLEMDSVALAELIEKVHNEYTSVIRYNDENSLSSVLAIAYLSAMKFYFKPVRELPTGYGFADFVFMPKPQYSNSYPALLVELKWNKNAETALEQIKKKKYPSSLQNFSHKILLVGINYDKKEKKHSCKIEEFVE